LSQDCLLSLFYRIWFKKIVYQTNHRNVEKMLLSHESLQQSLRLILMDAYDSEEPKITSLVKSLYRKCPTLFNTLLPRSEQKSLRSQVEEDEEEDSMSLESDDHHRHVTATGCLSATYCKNVLQVPTCSSDSALMTSSFESQLREALARDYRIPAVMHFGNNRFQWCKKVSFTTRYILR